jgi:hypothetical protein
VSNITSGDKLCRRTKQVKCLDVKRKNGDAANWKMSSTFFVAQQLRCYKVPRNEALDMVAN